MMECVYCSFVFICLDGADHDGLDYSREAGIPLKNLIHLVVSINCMITDVQYLYTYTQHNVVYAPDMGPST